VKFTFTSFKSDKNNRHFACRCIKFGHILLIGYYSHWELRFFFLSLFITGYYESRKFASQFSLRLAYETVSVAYNFILSKIKVSFINHTGHLGWFSQYRALNHDSTPNQSVRHATVKAISDDILILCRQLKRQIFSVIYRTIIGHEYDNMIIL
jgi:hypothetical protein